MPACVQHWGSHGSEKNTTALSAELEVNSLNLYVRMKTLLPVFIYHREEHREKKLMAAWNLTLS